MRASAFGLVALVGACVDPAAIEIDVDPVDAGPVLLAPWPAAPDPCALGPADPPRLLVTTTDFSTGAISVVDTETLVVTPDVAVGSTDAIPFYDPFAQRSVVVHRLTLDYLDLWSDPDFTLRGQISIDARDGPSNAQAVAFTPDGHAWVTTLGTRWLRELDLSAPASEAEVDAIDLSAFADPDGNPEASVLVSCGAQIYVAVQRLDPSFSPVDVDMLVAIDAAQGLPIDLDADTPGGQGLPLLGSWLRQLRVDPADASGRTLLGLTTGIERIDTVTGTTSWAVPSSAFAAAGLGTHRLAQAFDVDGEGTRAYVAAYVEDYSEVRLYVVGLDGAEPHVPEPFAEGFDSVEHTLELVGDRLWYGSTQREQPGLWVFDVAAVPPAIVAGPLTTGLPPYSIVGLP